jgi:2-polyprenyl-3-methyl-5-hydroxy-6-metoxy-1,4-benzoquinol methylase
MRNGLVELLVELGISNQDSIALYHPRTRDDLNIKVLKCSRSGVIVLEHQKTSDDYYIQKQQPSAGVKSIHTSEGEIPIEPLEDDRRRYADYRDMIQGKDILDFGCGKGGFLKLAEGTARSTTGIELNRIRRKAINDLGIRCLESVKDLGGAEKFDVIFLNHVLEHLYHPIEVLRELRGVLGDNGQLVIEVPHSRDVMLSTFDLESFKNFIFWSEHLILHTRESLGRFASEAGLKEKEIKGFQRYPLSNHFNWLFRGEPCGHTVLDEFNDPKFHKHYEKLLSGLDKTDTLIGIFTKT